VDCSRQVRLIVSKHAASSHAGPGLSAIRASCDLWAEGVAGLASVFERIGEQLDAVIAQPGLDHFFTADRGQIVVAISDAKWKNAVLFTAYSAYDVEPITLCAKSALNASIADCENAGLVVGRTDFIPHVWTEWSRVAGKGVRSGTAILENSPDLQVGSLFLCFPDVRRQLEDIARSGDVPMLAVALSSIGTTRLRLKCTLRAVAFPLPRWACASGAVAGHA